MHIGNNSIPVEDMNEIIAIVEAKPAMKVLCAVPLLDKTITELDVSGQSLGVEGAIVIRRYLENNGALTSLNLAGNSLKAEGAKHVAEAIKGNVSALRFD